MESPRTSAHDLGGAEAALRRFPVQVLSRMTDGNFELELIQWVRLGVLILCFGGAAWLDHKTRRVSNEWWWAWAKPTLFLLCLELIILDADWMIWATASAAVAFASTALIGRPDINDITNGSIVDIIVTIWYFVSGDHPRTKPSCAKKVFTWCNLSSMKLPISRTGFIKT